MGLRDIHNYAEDVCRIFGFDHCSAFIKTSDFASEPLLGITETESSRAINEKYMKHSIFKCDPFMGRGHEAELNRGNDIFAVMTPKDAGAGSDLRRFWGFMTENDMGEAGASRRRIGTGLDVVIGLHRREDPARPSVDHAALQAKLSSFQDLIVRHLLHRALDSGRGFGIIQSLAVRSAAPSVKLSPQEIRIASLVKAGKRNKEIAFILDITENTVEGHLRNAFRKLNVHNRTSLISAMGSYH